MKIINFMGYTNTLATLSIATMIQHETKYITTLYQYKQTRLFSFLIC